MAIGIGRRQFISALGSAAFGWPLAASAQQPALPMVGLVNGGSADGSARAAAFRNGLNETGTIDGQNVTVEFHWLEGQYDRLPALLADLIRRQVAVIVAVGAAPAVLAAKAATSNIPIVFNLGRDPVQLGVVASVNRPGGNLTGAWSFAGASIGKSLGLLHEIVPKGAAIAMLSNPSAGIVFLVPRHGIQGTVLTPGIVIALTR